jgi:hypothetical protein
LEQLQDLQQRALPPASGSRGRRWWWPWGKG